MPCGAAEYPPADPVRLLLDTHFVLWWLAGSSKLGAPARRLIGTVAVEGRVLLTRDAVLLALADRASLKFVREG